MTIILDLKKNPKIKQLRGLKIKYTKVINIEFVI